MREHHGQAVDAAVLLRERLEQLTSQLFELESLRARVLVAGRRTQITADPDTLTARGTAFRDPRQQRAPVSPSQSSRP